MKIKRLGTGWMVVVLVFMLGSASVTAQTTANPTAPTDALRLNVKAAILMEAETGEVLYALNEQIPYQPASMTKMMTEYIILEEIKAGRLKWDDQLMTSKQASDAIGSGQLLAEGRSYGVKEVFELLSVYSGNDAAVSFAEHISGTEEQFANKMNEAAKNMGLSPESRFINATGLSRKDMGDYAPELLTGETLLTALDSAKLARRIVLDHPEVLETTKLPTLTFRGKDKMVNWNWMVEGNKGNVNLRQFAYEGLDGLKTGHTRDAGYCFTGTAIRQGTRLISVIIGADSMENRFRETRRLLDYGFGQFESKTVLPAKSVVPEMKEVFIENGLVQNVPVVAGAGVNMIVSKKTTQKPKITVTLYPQDKLQAPLKAEDTVGTIKVEYGKQVKEVPLVVAEQVEEAGFFRQLWRSISGFFSGLVQGIIDLF